MAFYSNFHHSNHPNFKQPYNSQNRPSRRTMDGTSGRSINGSGGNGGGARYGNEFGTGLDSFAYQQQNGADGTGFAGQTNDGSTLWMGNIDDVLNEHSIKYAFSAMGVNVTNIKIIRNKDDGAPAGYGFVTFEDRDVAQQVLRDLNGKKIPNMEEDKRFFLKRANRTQQKLSIFVGNLTPDITNEILHQAFANCYPSTISARVITSDGQSKGFGFVEFGDEYDYFSALNQPNMMLGPNPISVSKARHSNNTSQPNRLNSANGRFPSNDNTRTRRNY